MRGSSFRAEELVDIGECAEGHMIRRPANGAHVALTDRVAVAHLARDDEDVRGRNDGVALLRDRGLVLVETVHGHGHRECGEPDTDNQDQHENDTHLGILTLLFRPRAAHEGCRRRFRTHVTLTHRRAIADKSGRNLVTDGNSCAMGGAAPLVCRGRNAREMRTSRVERFTGCRRPPAGWRCRTDR
jgi:hypothetical protein